MIRPGLRWYFSFLVALGLALEVERVLCCFLWCGWEGSVAARPSPGSPLADRGSQWYGKHLPLNVNHYLGKRGVQGGIPCTRDSFCCKLRAFRS